MTDAEMREEERTILQYYKIDPAYFSEKYNIPIIGERDSSLEQEREASKQLSRADDFFA